MGLTRSIVFVGCLMPGCELSGSLPFPWGPGMKKRIFLTECRMGVGSGRGASNVHPCTMEAKRGIRAAFSLCCGGIPQEKWSFFHCRPPRKGQAPWQGEGMRKNERKKLEEKKWYVKEGGGIVMIKMGKVFFDKIWLLEYN